jgi:hypothetical protein
MNRTIISILLSTTLLAGPAFAGGGHDPGDPSGPTAVAGASAGAYASSRQGQIQGQSQHVSQATSQSTGVTNGGNTVNISGGAGFGGSSPGVFQPQMLLDSTSAPTVVAGMCQGSLSGALWVISAGGTHYDKQTCAIVLGQMALSVFKDSAMAMRLFCTNDQWRSVNKAACGEGTAPPQVMSLSEPATNPVPYAAAVLPRCGAPGVDRNAACVQGY